MGLLSCPRCNAKTITNSIDEGRGKLDHALGLYLGKPCEDGKCELTFIESENTDSNPIESENLITTSLKASKKATKKTKSKFV